MIGKGNLHADSQKLAAYLITGKAGERAELVELRDFASPDIFEAFADVDLHAERTDCEKPLFHCSVRLPEGEELFRTQWAYVADRIEKRLEFAGQGRAIAFHHQQNGDTHMHIAWSRIDTKEWKAIDPGLYKNKLNQICRDLEVELGLTRVRSGREEGQKTLAPDRHEFEQSRRLHTDVKAIRETIRDCWDRSDNGRSFEAALAEHGYVLARGDKRDFVVIDNAGGDHALGKRINGVSATETRARLTDINKENLLTVAEAKQQIALQAERNTPAKEVEPGPRPETAQEFAAAARRTTEPAAPVYDRDADNAEWEAKLTDAAIEQVEAERRASSETAREFKAAANRTTEPNAPIYDRDADNAEWEAKLTDAAINADAERSALEGRQEPGTAAGHDETRAGGPEPSGGAENALEAE